MRRDDSLIVGRLGKHGWAPYRFEAHQEVSYFVKVLTERGVRVLWGKDLKRAINESVTKPKLGDVIGARRTARQSVIAGFRPIGPP